MRVRKRDLTCRSELRTKSRLSKKEKYKLQYAKTVLTIHRWRGKKKSAGEVEAVWRVFGEELIEKRPYLLETLQRVI